MGRETEGASAEASPLVAATSLKDNSTKAVVAPPIYLLSSLEPSPETEQQKIHDNCAEQAQAVEKMSEAFMTGNGEGAAPEDEFGTFQSGFALTAPDEALAIAAKNTTLWVDEKRNAKA